MLAAMGNKSLCFTNMGIKRVCCSVIPKNFLVFLPLISNPPAPELSKKDFSTCPCEQLGSLYLENKKKPTTGDGITLYSFICFIGTRHWHYNHQFVGFVVASLHVILLYFIKRTSYLQRIINLAPLKHFYSSFQPFYSNLTDGQLI